MNPHLEKLRPYPFEKLRQLKRGIIPPNNLPHIALSIGEPKHPTPRFILEALSAALEQIATYPTTVGTVALREAIVEWLTKRFSLPLGTLDPERHAIPVNGTREALFALAQCIINPAHSPLVFMPNPCYQVYEGAAFLAGAKPYYLNCTEATDFLPDLASIPKTTWQKCQLFYLCSPGNPTGAVLNLPLLEQLIEFSERYDFVIASDECYSEVYLHESQPPPGLLQAAAHMGRTDYRRCMVFHSFSKRSNVPGLRTGFVAGDSTLIESFLRYRTYHGCAMPLHTQAASLLAWRDEVHVIENRRRYRSKFRAVEMHLSSTIPLPQPAGGLYLWPKTPGDDVDFARRLFASMNVTVLPGTYLSRTVGGLDPGCRRVRMALVPSLEECIEAADRIAEFIRTSC